MRFFFLLLFFALFTPVILLSQTAEEVLSNGIVRASMPFEDEDFVGFQLLIEYNEELHVCTFKVISDIQELQNCEKLDK
tara:strand:+ start:1587 stop:1823 length:237 start_codon:yes stop_codon:yes gene_type:complete